MKSAVGFFVGDVIILAYEDESAVAQIHYAFFHCHYSLTLRLVRAKREEVLIQRALSF